MMDIRWLSTTFLVGMLLGWLSASIVVFVPPLIDAPDRFYGAEGRALEERIAALERWRHEVEGEGIER